ncbi:MAG: TIGR04086 family membrane protein [Clostridia bacterium]|nr:TIGR04086 family membrane protein [Clostridia bacterium]
MKGNFKRDESAGSAAFLGAALRGVLIGIGTAAVLTLILSAVALAQEDPDRFTGIFAYAALFIGALACGLASMKLDREHGMISPLIGGAGYVLVLWLVSLFFRADAVNAVSPLAMSLGYLGCIAAALAGGLIGRPKRVRIDTAKKNPTALVRKQLGRR